VPEGEAVGRVGPPGQIGPPKDGHDPRRMGERRELGHELGRDQLGARQAFGECRALCVDERFDRLEARVEAGSDQILSRAGEQAELVALTARRELAHELQPRVGR
jgi:hypothetical protein